MASFREFPVKSLPECLRMDLRRKKMWIPPEVQMRIMYYTEIAETRDNKNQVMKIICQVPNSEVFQMPQSLWNGFRFPTFIRTACCRPLQNEASCHWCGKFYAEMLSIGISAELNRPNPNLDRLFSEASWVAIELYLHKTHRSNTEGWLCQTHARPAHLNTA